jgi:hypothetical protein
MRDVLVMAVAGLGLAGLFAAAMGNILLGMCLIAPLVIIGRK